MLQELSEEICRYIYRNYYLDEINIGKDVLAYFQDDRMIFSITNCGDRFEVLVIFNDDVQRINVSDTETWGNAKQLLVKKLNPNRERWSEETRITSVNGGRCDMCVHYIHHKSDDEYFKKYVKSLLDERWGDDCGHDTPCFGQKKACGGLIPISLPFGMSTSADTITYAILPFVKDLM